MTPGRTDVVYVGSWGRSGSTLLDLVLGQVPGFCSVGELRYLWDRGLGERQRCGCGVPVPDCPFWGAVLEETFGAGRGLDAPAMLALWRRVDGLARLPLLFAPRRPAALENDLRAFREILGRLYLAVRVVSGASVVVDSSKYAAYGRILAGVRGLDLRVLHLVRDSRAVAYSWMRRKPMPEVASEARFMPLKRPWRSALFWNLENLGLHLLRGCARGYRVLRYDDLATDPRTALGAALDGIGIQSDLRFLRDGRIHLGPNHTVAGNPLRFRRGEVPIRPDVEWRSRLGPAPRWVVTGLTWPLLVRYGFPLAVRA
ncbi:MAG TPA: hypothetical protein VMN37_06565 [Gemmatimonadales bacterium]|nr:hypothetical protein [Gemmatimonadales bacterium]